MKRRRNPYTSNYVCPRTPHKIRYTKAVFAWEVGARRIKESGEQLYIYRCTDCGGWHLTSKAGGSAIRIETKAAPVEERETA